MYCDYVTNNIFILQAAIQLGDDALLNLCLRATIVIIRRARDAEILQFVEAAGEVVSLLGVLVLSIIVVHPHSSP